MHTNSIRLCYLPNLWVDCAPNVFALAFALVSTWTLNPDPALKRTNSLYVCCASSRVGETTTALNPTRWGSYTIMFIMHKLALNHKSNLNTDVEESYEALFWVCEVKISSTHYIHTESFCKEEEGRGIFVRHSQDTCTKRKHASQT